MIVEESRGVRRIGRGKNGEEERRTFLSVMKVDEVLRCLRFWD